MTHLEIREDSRFIPRDLSWLQFNARVLEECLDPSHPLLERIKFLAIFANNFDEFFMVRIAGLQNLISAQVNQVDAFGHYSVDVLHETKRVSTNLIKKSYEIYQKVFSPELEKNRIYVKQYKDLNKEQKRFIEEYFQTILYPIITPLAVDPGHPFPILPSKTMAFAVGLKQKGSEHLAIVPVPQNVPRVIRLPSGKKDYVFFLVDNIIRQHLGSFFKGYKIKNFFLFRVMRDSELDVDEEFSPNLLKTIEGEVKKRKVAHVVSVQAEQVANASVLAMLSEGLEFPKEDVLFLDNDLDLTLLFDLIRQVDRPEFCFPGYLPGKIEYENIFERMKEGDFITHLPFQSFYPTVDLIRTAAKDPHVLAIKMTLYRTNNDSAIIDALKEAAANRKQVTILVEIKARFDEESNIKWSRELEEAGCHVIYGIPGYKVHSKMALIVREENAQIQRYVHLSTGNYNEKTARIYTDIGYFTANDDFARDVSEIFNVITGYSMPTGWERIISAPNDLREYLFSLIEREMKFQKKNKNGLILAKMNSLEDPRIIEKLYSASKAGVKVKLIVRGICCLIPEVQGLSDNIEVKSTVGRFLEHTRMFLFNNNDNARIFLSSADWMRRNFDGRVELLFEIYKEDIKEHLKSLLELYWKDHKKSWRLCPDGKYEKLKGKEDDKDIQHEMIKHYEG